MRIGPRRWGKFSVEDIVDRWSIGKVPNECGERFLAKGGNIKGPGESCGGFVDACFYQGVGFVTDFDGS